MRGEKQRGKEAEEKVSLKKENREWLLTVGGNALGGNGWKRTEKEQNRNFLEGMKS